MANTQKLIFSVRDIIDEVIDAEERGIISNSRTNELLDKLNDIEVFLQWGN